MVNSLHRCDKDIGASCLLQIREVGQLQRAVGSNAAMRHEPTTVPSGIGRLPVAQNVQPRDSNGRLRFIFSKSSSSKQSNEAANPANTDVNEHCQGLVTAELQEQPMVIVASDSICEMVIRDRVPL